MPGARVFRRRRPQGLSASGWRRQTRTGAGAVASVSPEPSRIGLVGPHAGVAGLMLVQTLAARWRRRAVEFFCLEPGVAETGAEFLILLENLGRLVARRRWYVIGVWIVVAGLALPLAPRVGQVLRAGGISGGGLESDAAFERYQEDFGSPGSAVSVVFHSEELKADDPAFIRAAESALRPLIELEYVEAVLPFWDNPTQVAASGYTAYAAVVVDIDDERAHQIVPEIRDAVGASELETHVAGAAAFYTDIQITSENDLRRAEIIGLPFALLALLLVFGSVVAAGVPVAAGGISVIVGLASVFLLGQVTSFSIFALNVVTLLGLGLGADYSLFLVSRFREEMGRGVEPHEAVVITVTTAGRAVLFSGLAVMIGLASLTMFEFMMLRSIGIGGTVVTAIAVLAATTLVPAILAVLGPNIDRGRIWRPRVGIRDGWRRLARLVMRHAGLVFVLVGAVLLLMGAPLLRIRVSAPDASILTDGSPSRRAYELLSREFGVGHVALSFVVARFDDGALAPEGLEAMYRLGLALEADERVVRVRSALNIDPRLTLAEYRLLYAEPDRITEPYAAGYAAVFTRENSAVMSIEPRTSASSPEARELVDAIREYRDRHGLDLLVGRRRGRPERFRRPALRGLPEGGGGDSLAQLRSPAGPLSLGSVAAEGGVHERTQPGGQFRGAGAGVSGRLAGGAARV